MELEPTAAEARELLISLIENDDWRITTSAEADARKILSKLTDHPSQYDIIRFVLALLQKSFPMHVVKLGEPPGSLGNGYVMNNADGKGLYIKLKIEDDVAWVLSFHRSKHAKGK